MVILGTASVVTIVGMMAPMASAVAAKATADSPFCTNLSSNTTKITGSITSLTGKLDSARTAEDQKVASDRAKWAAEIQAARTKADTQRQDGYAKLMAKATTDTEKAAVTAYETSITDAVSVRRTANDTARATFQSGVDSARAARRSTVNSQASAFTSAVNTAISTAETSCAADSSAAGGPAIRTAFIASLKSARTTFQGARKDDDKIGDQVKALAATRDAAIKANDVTFESAAKAARQTLQTVFGKSSI